MRHAHHNGSSATTALTVRREELNFVDTAIARHARRAGALSPLLEEQQAAVQPTSFALLGLTQREAEVLQWVAQGKTNIEIGIILGISAETVRKHLQHIFEKLGVETRTAAIAVAFGHAPGCDEECASLVDHPGHGQSGGRQAASFRLSVRCACCCRAVCCFRSRVARPLRRRRVAGLFGFDYYQLDLYRLTKDNILSSDPTNPLARVPIGEARSRGIGLDRSGQLTPHWMRRRPITGRSGAPG